MKNLINYYYNLIIKDFKKTGDSFTFEINKIKYAFLNYDGNVKEIYNIYSLINSNYKYCHEIIINNNNTMITMYENKPYILLRKNISLSGLVTIDAIINYDVLVLSNYEFNWKELWKNKMDYYEYQINQFGFKYPIIRDSFGYYVGLSELAISILNFVNKTNLNSYISHKRINFKEKMDDFLNPLNIIIDNRARDIGEYYKINYINDNLSINEVLNDLDKINFNKDEAIMFLVRLLYPSYYFDLYDKIIQQKVNEEKINYYIKKNVCYETFLKQIYKYIKIRYNIFEIEFLEN